MLTKMYTEYINRQTSNSSCNKRYMREIENWYVKTIELWANEINGIVWLDAPDTCLMNRIRTRNKLHPVKDLSDQEAHCFIKSYRKSYDHILSVLLEHGKPTVISFDTQEDDLEEIVNKIINTFNLQSSFISI